MRLSFLTPSLSPRGTGARGASSAEFVMLFVLAGGVAIAGISGALRNPSPETPRVGIEAQEVGPAVSERDTVAQPAAESGPDLRDALLVAGSLGVLGVSTGSAVVVSRRRRRSLGAGADLATRWERVERRKGKLLDAWGGHCLDALDVLRRPSLSDPGYPETASWLEALAGLLTVPDTQPASTTEVERCEKIVGTGELAWQHACAVAERRGLSSFSDAERQRILRATAFLEMVRDEATTMFERQACYLKAIELLEGLVVIPREARGELEAAVRRALPAGSAGSAEAEGASGQAVPA